MNQPHLTPALSPPFRGGEGAALGARGHLIAGGRVGTSLGLSDHPLNAVFTNGYEGLYILIEKIKRGRNRLDLKKLGPDDLEEPAISGGYLLKKDCLGPNERGVLTGQEFNLVFVDPKESELRPEQKRWITRYIDGFEKALYGLDFRDPARGYGRYIDVESFVDYHWLTEVGKNADGYAFSQYFYKDRGGKLRMGPVWDGDSTFGNSFYRAGHRTNGWRFEQMSDPDYSWYRRLFEDPDFFQRSIDRWSELRETVFATSNVLALVDSISGRIRAAQVRNNRRWNTLEPMMNPVYGRIVTDEGEIQWLKQWIVGRLAWIDSQDFPRPTIEESRVGTETRWVMRGVGGRIFYTMDGSDPRVAGGGVSPAVREYREPVALSAGARVCARIRSSFGIWSPPVRWSGSTRRAKNTEDK